MAKLLKDLYNNKYIHVISKEIKKVYKEFDEKNFEVQVFTKEWHSRELKQRMRHISTTLGLFLPVKYEESIEVLKEVFPKISTKYSLENMIFQDFVEVYGLNDFEISMSALEIFTVESSSEFAIRQFLLKYPKKTMKQMRIWSNSSNEHVRRLSSEGSRSRLPWAVALDEFKHDPGEVIEILELLKDDDSPYVRKSVANSLNDISKDKPGLVKEIALKWLGKSTKRDALVKHGCRTLLKRGDKDTLELFGFFKTKDIHVQEFKISNIVLKQEYLEFSFVINSKKTLSKLRVEYMIGFLRANGTYGEKVFQICEGDYKSKSKKITKKHSFKTISTRKYYAGIQKIAIVINGDIFKENEFMLELN